MDNITPDLMSFAALIKLIILKLNSMYKLLKRNIIVKAKIFYRTPR